MYMVLPLSPYCVTKPYLHKFLVKDRLNLSPLYNKYWIELLRETERDVYLPEELVFTILVTLGMTPIPPPPPPPPLQMTPIPSQPPPPPHYRWHPSHPTPPPPPAPHLPGISPYLCVSWEREKERELAFSSSFTILVVSEMTTPPHHPGISPYLSVWCVAENFKRCWPGDIYSSTENRYM